MFDLLWERLVTQGMIEGAEDSMRTLRLLSAEAELLKERVFVR